MQSEKYRVLFEERLARVNTFAPFEPLEFPANGQRVEQGASLWNNAGRERLYPLMNEAFEKFPHHRSCIEVGTWAGGNALRIYLETIAQDIYCVDTWQGSRPDKPDSTTGTAAALGPRAVFQTFCRNVGDLLLRNIHPCVGRSATWAKIWPFQVPAIFIDAGHDYESVTEDLIGWWEHLLPGGLYCGHDFEMFPDVKRAVTDWADIAEGDLSAVREVHHEAELWWVWKPEETPNA